MLDAFLAPSDAEDNSESKDFDSLPALRVTILSALPRLVALRMLQAVPGLSSLLSGAALESVRLLINQSLRHNCTHPSSFNTSPLTSSPIISIHQAGNCP